MTQSDMSDLERRDTCGTVFLANLRTLYLLLPYHNTDQIRLANPCDGSGVFLAVSLARFPPKRADPQRTEIFGTRNLPT